MFRKWHDIIFSKEALSTTRQLSVICGAAIIFLSVIHFLIYWTLWDFAHILFGVLVVLLFTHPDMRRIMGDEK